MPCLGFRSSRSRATIESDCVALLPRVPIEVAEAGSLSEALSRIRCGSFDLVLVGAGLQLQLFKAARDTSPSTRFAVISGLDTRADILASLDAGFHGFISKRQSGLLRPT